MEDFLNEDINTDVPAQQKNFSEEWIRYVLEYNLPDMPEEERQQIIGMLKPILNVAAKTNIPRREIPLHLRAYDIIWEKYFMYMKRGKYDPRLLVAKESMREGFDLHLNRSVDGFQSNLLFTHRNFYNVLQKNISGTKRKILGGFRNKEEE